MQRANIHTHLQNMYFMGSKITIQTLDFNLQLQMCIKMICVQIFVEILSLYYATSQI